jgi:hypothetical protein
MQNNIPVHNHTVYSYLQALLTDRHTVSALCSQSTVSIHTTLNVMDTDNNVCNRKDDDDDNDSDIPITELSWKILSILYISTSFIRFAYIGHLLWCLN